MYSRTLPISQKEFEKAIGKLPDDALFTVKQELENFLRKLTDTNEILKAEIPLATPEDKVIYEEALEENKPLIQRKRTFLEFLIEELTIRGLCK